MRASCKLAELPAPAAAAAESGRTAGSSGPACLEDRSCWLAWQRLQRSFALVYPTPTPAKTPLRRLFHNNNPPGRHPGLRRLSSDPSVLLA